MQYRVLGPLEVVRDGEALDLGRPKQRALLAALVVHAGRVVSSDALVEELWRDGPPADPAAALQVQVSRLRRVLGPAAVESRRPGYLLRAGPDDVDAAVFERLVVAGDAALAAGRPGEAAGRLSAALDQWRGPALVDLPDHELARAEAVRLEELRLHALESLAEARLAGGGHAAAVADLQALAEAHPLRERLWGHLMVALYRSGRQADALRAYGRLRANLGEELGIEPSPALRRLEEAVLLQRPELDLPAAAAAAAPDQAGGPEAPDGGPFVGREAELGRLVAELDQAANGLRVVLVAGEPGVGKTRLTAELAAVARRRGARVLVGTCAEELALPFQPFADALGRVVGTLAGDELAALTAGRGADLARLLPDLPELVPGLAPPAPGDPDTGRWRLFEAVRRAVEMLAGGRPLLLVLDDLHWAAGPTLALLRHLVLRSEAAGVLVVGTYRHTEAADPLGEAARSPRVTELRLGGLDRVAVEGLVAALLGHDLDDAGAALARRIHEGTAGNALFVQELVRHLRDSGAAETDVPAGVRDVVRRRLARLSAGANRALAAAAVAGADFDVRVAGTAAGVDEDDALAGLEEAIAAGLVEDRGDPARMRFAHALVRAAIDDGLAGPRRAQLHRRVGEAIEALHAGRLDDHLPELARHFALGGAGDRAVPYAMRAGDRALAGLAHEEAAAHYGQALALLDGGAAVDQAGARCDALLGLGEAQRRAGDPAHRATLLAAAETARGLRDAGRLAKAALANTRSFWSATRQVDEERVAALRDALAAVDPGDSPLRARLLAKLAVELVYSGDAAEVCDLSDRAVAMARRSGDLPTLAAVLAPRYNTVRGDPRTLPGRLDDTAELLEVAERLPDPVLRAEARGWRAVACWEAGEAAEGDAAFAAFERLAAGLRQPTMRWYAGYLAAARALHAGRLAEAAGLIDEALAFGRAAGQPDAGLFANVQRLVLDFERGALDGWARVLRIMAGEPASRWFAGSWLAVRACELDRPDEASALWAELAEGDFAGLRFEPTWLHIVANLATACAAVGDARRAGLLGGLLEPCAGQVVTLTSLAYGGAVDHHLGLLAACRHRPAEARLAFARAVAIEERMGAPIWAARSRLAWSSCAADPAEAAGLAGEARAVAAARGAAAVEGQAARRLAQLGAPVRG
ncbi:MAG TPA: BTAD domain-containing putative transcriptional regulator [Acidimicrobiales bacterium]|nr:BTAD domain-containing putative transcriptional regulator [Acidimicrobiales bacterium]